MDLFSLLLVLIFASLYGVTMKVADLLNEHGLKWFRGSAILFGILWGMFGTLLVVSDVYIANIVLAMAIAFIVRMRIDYINHAIAEVIIIVSFLTYSTFVPAVFFIFLPIFIVFGGMKDLLDDYYKRKDLFAKISESMWYYPIPTLIYATYTSQWVVFYVFTIFTVFYDVTKYIDMKKRSHKNRKRR